MTREQNLLLNKIDIKEKGDICKSRPVRLYIDITNHCNYECVLCPHSKHEPLVEKGYMSEEMYHKIIDSYGDEAQRLSLHNWGEPLLHPHVCDYIKYAVKKGLEVKLSTNLSCLSKTLAYDLIKSGLHGITVSIHAGTPHIYKKYTQRDLFKQVVENLKMLVNSKKELKSLTPVITWFFVVNRYNYKEIDIAKKMAESIGVDAFVTIPTRTMMDEEALLTRESKVLKYGEWIPDDINYNKYWSDKAKDPDKICTWPWERLVFDWNGSVYPCCLIYGDSYKICKKININEINLVWNSQAMIDARRDCRGKGRQNTVCSICYNNGFTDFV